MWTKKEVCGLVDLTSLNAYDSRSEEHTSELQSRPHLVCRLLLEKKKTCTTCKKILKHIEALDQFELQDIKSTPVTEPQLAEIYAHTTSYEDLFHNREQLYQPLVL